MEYQQQYHQIHPHQQMHPGQSQLPGLLPDVGSASEKAMMWGGVQQYMPESGYSTQAPSICGSIDPFANDNNGSNMNGMDSGSTTTASASTIQNDWNYKQNVQQQQQQSFAPQQQQVCLTRQFLGVKLFLMVSWRNEKRRSYLG